MQDKAVIVTGAFGVLGGAVLALLAERGARVAAVDVASAPGHPLPASAVALGGYDLADAGAAGRAVETAISALGKLDGLINIAGGFAWETLADGSADTWDRLYRMNVSSSANMCRAAIPHLIATHGRIVNIGAGGAVKAAAGMGAYAAAKGGVHRLTEALADELKGRVAVNAVLPSIIDTPLNRQDMPNADFAAWVAPLDLAEVIVFLVSEQARAVTGALLAVNGGV
jgi:NAD(P)-dependent dehydrogenase (short-subunit alcohol dehydrogenase family)